MDEPPRVPPDKISEKAGHRDRLRQKFLNGGLTAFLDYEIVELLLTLGTPRRDCKRAAREALREFKTFGGVLEARGEDLQRIGVGCLCLGRPGVDLERRAHAGRRLGSAMGPIRLG